MQKNESSMLPSLLKNEKRHTFASSHLLPKYEITAGDPKVDNVSCSGGGELEVGAHE